MEQESWETVRGQEPLDVDIEASIGVGFGKEMFRNVDVLDRGCRWFLYKLWRKALPMGCIQKPRMSKLTFYHDLMMLTTLNGIAMDRAGSPILKPDPMLCGLSSLRT